MRDGKKAAPHTIWRIQFLPVQRQHNTMTALDGGLIENIPAKDGGLIEEGVLKTINTTQVKKELEMSCLQHTLHM